MTVLRSERLTLRPVGWQDLEWLVELNADLRVMATLGGVRARDRVEAWLEGEREQFGGVGYCRNVVRFEDARVGVVGLSRRDFDAGLVPGVELSWQLGFEFWGRGFATEAARCVLADAFARLGLAEIVAVTSAVNWRSRAVMGRLAMVHSPRDAFVHPRLAESDPLCSHVVYRLTRWPVLPQV